MNIVTVADIKRSGFAVLEAALAKGPVQLMKRTRPSAVVLRPEDYDRLLAQRANDGASSSALNLLLQPDAASPAKATAPGIALDAAGMRARLAELNDGWIDR